MTAATIGTQANNTLNLQQGNQSAPCPTCHRCPTCGAIYWWNWYYNWPNQPYQPYTPWVNPLQPTWVVNTTDGIGLNINAN